MKKKYQVNTYDYGTHYVWALSARAARNRIGYRIYGKHFADYGEVDMWSVTEIV